MTFKELRQCSGMNQTQFAKYFEIPLRTVQNWEGGINKCPEYLLKLMQYKLENQKIVDSVQSDRLKEMHKRKYFKVVKE